MPRLCADGQTFDVSCVVFDKDGTLLDFEQAWGRRTVQWINAMVAAVNGDQELADLFFHSLGYDFERRQAELNGPILAVSEEKLVTLAAGILYAQSDLPWAEAEALTIKTGQATMSAPLGPEEIQPLGDVQGTLHRLREAGIAIAVATADNRAVSDRCLDLLGISDDVTIMICGDDPLPQKPDPGVLAWIAEQMELQPRDLLMVGDTLVDMLTGRNGGAAGFVAVDPNHEPGRSPFDELADAVLPTVAGLSIC